MTCIAWLAPFFGRLVDEDIRHTEEQYTGFAPQIQDPDEAAAADRLRLALGTKVEIHAKSKEKGEIIIHYYSQDELIRLYSVLTGRAIPAESDHAIHEGKRGG